MTGEKMPNVIVDNKSALFRTKLDSVLTSPQAAEIKNRNWRVSDQFQGGYLKNQKKNDFFNSPLNESYVMPVTAIKLPEIPGRGSKKADDEIIDLLTQMEIQEEEGSSKAREKPMPIPMEIDDKENEVEFEGEKNEDEVVEPEEQLLQDETESEEADTFVGEDGREYEYIEVASEDLLPAERTLLDLYVHLDSNLEKEEYFSAVLTFLGAMIVYTFIVVSVLAKRVVTESIKVANRFLSSSENQKKSKSEEKRMSNKDN